MNSEFILKWVEPYGLLVCHKETGEPLKHVYEYVLKREPEGPATIEIKQHVMDMNCEEFVVSGRIRQTCPMCKGAIEPRKDGSNVPYEPTEDRKL